MMKKLLCFALTMVILLGVALVPASAVSYPIVDVYVNGVKLVAYQPAIIINGRTMVPLRAICEALKCEVSWNPTTRTAQIQNELTIISVQIDNYKISKVDRTNQSNIEVIEIDVPPIIYNNSTLVPVRAISESMRARVDWDGTLRRVDVWRGYDSVGGFSDGVAVITTGNKKGLIDENGNIILPPVYGGIGLFEDGLAIVNDSVYITTKGVVNNKGTVVIPVKYTQLTRYGDVFVAGGVQGKGKCGMYDKNGKQILPEIYDSITSVDGNVFIIKADGFYGMTDKNGKNIAPIIYKEINSFIDKNFSSTHVLVVYGDKVGVLGVDGKQILPTQYDAVWTEGNFFKVEKKGANNSGRVYGIYSKTGEEIVPVICKSVNKIFTTNGQVYELTTINGKKGIMSLDGKIIVPAQFDSVGNYYDGFFEVRINSSYGVYDFNGKEIVPAIYDNVDKVSSREYFKVKKDGKYGLYDFFGKMIVAAEYSDIVCFSDAIQVEDGSLVGIYGLDGKCIIKAEYDKILQYDSSGNKFDADGYVYAYQGECAAIFHKSGKMVIGARYKPLYTYRGLSEKTVFNGDGYTAMEKDGLYGVVDVYGDIVLPFEYYTIGQVKKALGY